MTADDIRTKCYEGIWRRFELKLDGGNEREAWQCGLCKACIPSADFQEHVTWHQLTVQGPSHDSL